ncbi:hypothetical protein IE81DRAFT_369516 [Ceraceosorus guamensis]|uniref:Pentacotripeptide-repeat region of PRORP domain-containing protein n=1 Tax=Ceraceosorus guamensis TaxID=1522189 RepID=A0A316VNI9_9BASI|nr:hypothetical protein IE81DRAFT_369516 [Ceraceosorus guamensis]PWN38874.1 hypothetical protein IE81DRAFT_369516 [Ceraceosorus guamensis]
MHRARYGLSSTARVSLATHTWASSSRTLAQATVASSSSTELPIPCSAAPLRSICSSSSHAAESSSSEYAIGARGIEGDDFASMWSRGRRDSQQASSKRASTKSMGRSVTLREAERAILADIRSMNKQLSDVQQREHTKQAAERAKGEVAAVLDMELDDGTLDRLYKALSMPDPPDEQVKRLSARQEARLRLMAAVNEAKRLLPSNSEVQDGAANAGEVALVGIKVKESQASAPAIGTATSNSAKRLLEIESLPRRVRDEHKLRSRLGPLTKRIEMMHARLRGADDGARAEDLQEAVSVSRAQEAVDEMVAIAQSDVARDGQTDLMRDGEARRALFAQVEEVVQRFSLMAGSSTRPAALPVGLITRREWEALVVLASRASDVESQSRLLDAMKLSGSEPDTRLWNGVLEVYAEKGDVETCERMITSMSTHDAHTTHCLIKANLRSSLAAALDILASLEGASAKTSDAVALLPGPASLATYTLVLNHILTAAPKHHKPLFWSLYHRMRFAAHPTPDAPLYTLAIRACAEGIEYPGDDYSNAPRKRVADGERALDLFREMSVHHGIRPTAQTYNALMLVYARRKELLPEAFRLLKEMVALERERLSIEDVQARQELTCFAPDKRTFNALLNGCARNGDLARARWVLAEMLRNASALWSETAQERGPTNLTDREQLEVENRRPDDVSLMHVFNAYAAYVPPFKSNLRALRQKRAGATQDGEGERGGEVVDEATTAVQACNDKAKVFAGGEEHDEAVADDIVRSAGTDADDVADFDAGEASFDERVPMSSAEVVSEVRGLFARLLLDVESGKGLLSNVCITTFAVNSYLEALTRHSRQDGQFFGLLEEAFGAVEEAQEDGLFARLALQPNPKTFEIAMTLCGKVSSKSRERADQIGDALWKRWREYRVSGETQGKAIARVWAARIANLCKSDRIDEALETVTEFSSLYPPQGRAYATMPCLPAVLQPVTSKFMAQCAPNTTKDAPTLDFRDLNPLHHKLVNLRRSKDLRYVDRVAHHYARSSKPPKRSQPRREEQN